MELSLFDILGPVMVGPSSSHTAGAARLASVAAGIAGKPFSKVEFGLSGSLAKTFRGHGTDKALVAGVMGLAPDSEQISCAESLAQQRGLKTRFYPEELEHLHENAAHITFTHQDGTTTEVWGASIGGGRIEIRRIGDFDTKLLAERPTMIVQHLDRPGVISDVSRILADNHINIAVLRLSRIGKGGNASAMFVVDEAVPQQVQQQVQQLQYVEQVVVVDVP